MPKGATSTGATGSPSSDQAPRSEKRQAAETGGAGGLGFAIVRLGIVVGLLALTVWQWRRVDPLREAREAEARHDPLTMARRALDALDRRPNDPEANRLVARGLIRLDFPERAEPYFQKAQAAGRIGLDDLRERALALARTNRFEEAGTALEEVLQRHPDDAPALQSLAAMRLGQGRYREALAFAERLAALPEHAVAGQTLVASIYHESNRANYAAAAYERALQLDPELRTMPLPAPIFWHNFALDLLGSSQPAKARRYLLRALAHRNDAGLMDLLGEAYRIEGTEGAADQAERCFRQAIEWEPTRSDPWLHLGRLLLQPERNRPEEAIPYLQRAAALAPESFEPHYSLALAYKRLGRKDEADREQKLFERLRAKHAPGPSGMGAPSSLTAEGRHEN
jgi:tetratricopeptide (TPR) repeat protein